MSSPTASKIQYVLKVTAQLLFLIGLWWISALIQQYFHLPISAGVIGLILLLFALMSGMMKLMWIKSGADFILAELVLMFIPCVVGLVKYKQLFITQGWQLILAVVLGTLCVMVMTAYSVHFGFKLERKLQQKQNHRQSKVEAHS
ncbi:CidA/LrgA family protein [Acinetobacter kanungonis]|uniref:CidA/LrgA family protein n=1 Tax=Acinetobacter kanungonis TaxID=2699469 RepID=UPI001379C75E|nr:CidA/LrgA family protein [Acinetobacter kanungonis]NCI79116.1 CidA/LrgA family protein [Acinetobacter kanungonis]